VSPSWALKPGLTDRLVVGRKVTLTLTIFYVLQNMLIWNNFITNILGSKLRFGGYASYIMAT
jgi:hypothetical protein